MNGVGDFFSWEVRLASFDRDDPAKNLIREGDSYHRSLLIVKL